MGRREALDDEGEDLYAGPLQEFVQRRNALARSLREAGEREAADQVRLLRKPTVPAWALNQLVRQRPAQVGHFLEVADQLRGVQPRALADVSSREAMRATISAYREAVEGLGRQAAAILEEAGRDAAAHMPEVTASLQAAAVDDEARRQLREGTLTRPFSARGRGAALAPDPARNSEAELPPVPSKTMARDAQREELAAARLVRAKRQRREARQRLRVVEQAAQRLTRRAASAEKRAQRLAEDAAEAARDAREARQQADKASEGATRPVGTRRGRTDAPGSRNGSWQLTVSGSARGRSAPRARSLTLSASITFLLVHLRAARNVTATSSYSSSFVISCVQPDAPQSCGW